MTRLVLLLAMSTSAHANGFVDVQSSPMIPGQVATITVRQLPAFIDVELYITGDGPTDVCPATLSRCLDIGAPVFLSRTVTADQHGVATLELPVPPSVPGGLAVGVQGTVRFAGRDFFSRPLRTETLVPDGDADLDGLTNAEEGLLGTDPLLADTDGDELGDLDELLVGSSPLNPDTDGDLLLDGVEVALGTDPFSVDSDGDTLWDGWEWLLQLDPTSVDTDQDGLDDGLELRVLGTDPGSADSDLDGCPDATDPAPLVRAPGGDPDQDGLIGLCDPCPDLPGDGGPDSDGDGTPDACDLCPDVFNDSADDQDGDGLPNACDVCPDVAAPHGPDGDGDGTPDVCDPCPIHVGDDPDADGTCGSPLRIFASSNVYRGHLLSDADSECQQSGSFGLGGGTWLAWTPRDGVSTADRFAEAGMTGPWFLPSGPRVLDRVDQLPLDNPIQEDEYGLAVSGEVWTGTREMGLLALDCDNWSDPGSLGLVGMLGEVDLTWTKSNEASCIEQHHIYCLEMADVDGDRCADHLDAAPLVASTDTDGDGVADDCDVCPLDAGDDSDGDGVCDSADPCPEDAPDDPDADGLCGTSLVVFVTEAEYTADQVPAGLNICEPLATNAGLGLLIMEPWASYGGFDAVARFGLYDADGPWVRVDGTLVAMDFAELSSGTLRAPINLSENGNLVDGVAWTGLFADGSASTSDCDDWTGTGLFTVGRVGDTMATDGTWTSSATQSCTGDAHLYCFGMVAP